MAQNPWRQQVGDQELYYERRVAIHYALTLLGCLLICWNKLQGKF